MNGNYYDYERRKGDALARAYVPFQIMNQVFDSSEALKKGTLFPELYKPYTFRKMNINGGGFNG